MSSTNDNMFLKHTVRRSYSLNILYEHGLPTKTHILSISLSFPNHLKYMYPATEPVTINQTPTNKNLQDGHAHRDSN